MKAHALAALGPLLFSGAVQAAVIDLGDLADHGSGAGGLHARALPTVLHGRSVTPPAPLSELPEPDVLAMMLVGLVLIGYRAGRDSSEKFE